MQPRPTLGELIFTAGTLLSIKQDLMCLTMVAPFLTSDERLGIAEQFRDCADQLDHGRGDKLPVLRRIAMPRRASQHHELMEVRRGPAGVRPVR